MVVVDDSIVRGSTTRKLVAMLFEAGALEVHLRISSPPIISPCFYGIDMADQSQLIAAGRDDRADPREAGRDVARLPVAGRAADRRRPARVQVLPGLPDGRVPDRDPGRRAAGEAALRGPPGAGQRSGERARSADLRRCRCEPRGAADAVVARIKQAVTSTHSSEVMAQPRRLRRAVHAERRRPAHLGRAATASAPRCCSGVAARRLHGLGIDLVAMSANDVITSGGRPGVLPGRDHLRADRPRRSSPSWWRASPRAAGRPAARCWVARPPSTPT